MPIAPNYAGSLFFFGHGECTGAPGHCNPSLEERSEFDRRPGHPLRPRNYELNVTEALKAATAGNGQTNIRFSFVVLNAVGDQVAPEELDVPYFGVCEPYYSSQTSDPLATFSIFGDMQVAKFTCDLVDGQLQLRVFKDTRQSLQVVW